MAKVDDETVKPFSMSNEEIKKKIDETHAQPEKTFDVDSLFIIVENVLMHSTKIAEELVAQGSIQVNDLEKIEEYTPKPDFSVPLSVLKQIVCEFSCKAPSKEFTHKTTLSILKKLSNFSWVAKAVLVLAAFAMEFADFFLLAMLHQSVDQRLAKSLGTLKRVNVVLTKHSELQKRRQVIKNFIDLIKSTLKLTRTVCEWEKLSSYDPKGVPALSTTVVAYWIIATVVTCATMITVLTSDEDKPFDVSAYITKLESICNNLEEQLKAYRIKKEEDDYYWKVVKVLKDPTDIVEVLTYLFSTKDYVTELFDGSTKLKIEVLRKKHVLLLISGLEIPDAEVNFLNSIHIELKEKYDQYKIVWVPIVEQWTAKLEVSFDNLRSKIQCYTIEMDRATVGVTYIKNVWDFKGQTMVVVMNPQGKVENFNALHLIRLWGIEAFPFRWPDEARMLEKSNWIDPVMNKIQQAKLMMEKEDHYIFFFGGRKKEWAKGQFESNLNKIEGDTVIKTKITIKWYLVDRAEEVESFWSRVESMFLLMLSQEKADIGSTQEIQKLLSEKNDEEGWAVLSRGPVAIITGSSSKFIQVLEKFDEWKKNVVNKNFEVAFKEYYNSEIMPSGSDHCCRFDIPIVAGKAPEHMKCTECQRPMEMFISYKCCIKGD